MREKPLPNPVLRPVSRAVTKPEATGGILLGVDCWWNPEKLPNGHICIIGASGSGKTQTLKAIAYELAKQFGRQSGLQFGKQSGEQSGLQIIIVDFHGDQSIAGETAYPLHMNSPYGINPLVLNLDPAGGGPALQAIAVAASLRKNLQVGPNQEGLIIDVLGECYHRKGITNNPATWGHQSPTFSDFQFLLNQRAQRTEQPCKESAKLLLKLMATFTYGVFNRPAFRLDIPLVRVDLSKLPPEVGAIAADALAKQLMDNHRLQGECAAPRTYLFIDEAKELSKSPALDRIVCDGRKYGLNLVLASQSERHLSPDVLSNSATKIVLPVDQVEVEKVSKKFRFDSQKVAKLQPLQALCRFGTEAKLTSIIPYFRRVSDGH